MEIRKSIRKKKTGVSQKVGTRTIFSAETAEVTLKFQLTNFNFDKKIYNI